MLILRMNYCKTYERQSMIILTTSYCKHNKNKIENDNFKHEKVNAAIQVILHSRGVTPVTSSTEISQFTSAQHKGQQGQV